MIQSLKSRLLKVESANNINLPPVLHIDGSTSPPSLWNRGTSREEAESANTFSASLIEALGGPGWINDDEEAGREGSV